MNSGWAVAVANALASAVLINAGAAKLIAPGPLLQAWEEVFAAPSRRVGKQVVRGLGAGELMVAVALLVLPTRLASAIATSVLGLCFASLGFVGVLRRSSVPCGCFGGASRQPLGGANIGLGAALAVAWPLNALPGKLPMPGYSAAAALLASMASSILCLWLNRRLIIRLLPARRTPQPWSELIL
jgi:hypothetical protein